MAMATAATERKSNMLYEKEGAVWYKNAEVIREAMLRQGKSEKEIEKYVASGEPMDKAGSYGIQGGAALFCERMVGDYYNVMGLPVCRLWKVLAELAPEVMEESL